MEGKDFAICSMTCGICSLVFCLLAIVFRPLFVIAFIVSIIGIVNSSKSKKADTWGTYGGQSSAGYVTSLIALILSSIYVAVMFFVLILAIAIVA